MRLPKPLPAIKQTAAADKVALGKKLFFDPRLSKNERISCATCHDPAKGFSNGERFAAGVDGKPGKRHVPSLFNVGYHKRFFWDGRAASLEEQALAPIQSPDEMGMPLDDLVSKLKKDTDYRQRFKKVFGGNVTASRIAQAIAAYERTIVSHDTPFDHYLKGDKKALAPAALRGMRLFYGQARCFVCHKGPELTDHKFHNVGFGTDDVGRRGVTRKERDQGAFKTPGLREIGRTSPYGHNGRFKTLKEVVQHYNFGGVTDDANDHRDEELQVLYLVENQVDDLVAFLQEGLTTKKKTNP